jgi:hypothetical protein
VKVDHFEHFLCFHFGFYKGNGLTLKSQAGLEYEFSMLRPAWKMSFLGLRPAWLCGRDRYFGIRAGIVLKSPGTSPAAARARFRELRGRIGLPARAQLKL